MTDWLSKLDQLDIPDGAVAGLSNADKPINEGELLQLSAEDRPLFFRGQQIDATHALARYASRSDFTHCCLRVVLDFSRNMAQLMHFKCWSSHMQSPTVVCVLNR